MAGPWDDYAPQAASGSKPWEDYAPAAVTTGKAVNSIPRQLGLTARYGLEGVAQAGQAFTEPVAALMRLGGVKTKSLGEMATGLADWAGLPSPQGANERVIGDAARLVAGAGGMAGAAGAASSLPGMVGKVFSGLAANPMQQMGSAAGAGLAGGASREAGGDGWMQAGAGLAGGVLGGMAPGAIGGAVNAGQRMFAPKLSMQDLDIKLTETLGKAGADYSQLPGQVQRQLRAELATSLQAGKELDPQAVARLADFRTVGATPTRGMVTQNPVQITREMNLAKTAANSMDDTLHGMPMIQNQNNSTFIRNLNDAGAATGDSFKAGQGISNKVLGTNQGLVIARDAAYKVAREMPGAKDPLYPDAVRNIFGALDDKGIVGDLPPTISNYLNAFVSGAHKGPLGEMVPGPSFNVQAYENLQKQLSNAAMSPDSATRYAAGVARRALEDTKIQPITQTGRDFGMAPVTQEVAGMMRSRDGQAQALLAQLNEGRAAHKSLMQYGESTPVVKAIVNGAEPDRIFQKFVIGGTVADAQAVAREAPNAGVKEAILAHLKDKSLSGAADEVGKFSQAGYNKALNGIGEQKLKLFFNPEELAHLKAVGRVASYAQSQPVGSAVNNSNSGALLLGRGMDLLNKTPVLGPMVGPALKNINVSLQQRQAQNYLPGLLATNPKAPMLDGLMLPGLAFSGGLLSP